MSAKAILRPLLRPCDESWKLLLKHVFPKIAEKSCRKWAVKTEVEDRFWSHLPGMLRGAEKK